MKRMIVLALCIAAAASAERLKLDDAFKIVSVSDPQTSPDGKSIAAIVSTPNIAEDRSDSDIVLFDVATGGKRTLTQQRKGLTAPRWSPSGDRLAFIARVNGNEQLFVMPMNGGDARQTTTVKDGIQQYAWRPDGKAFAFVASDEKPEKKDRAKFEDAFEVGNVDYLAKEAALPSHVWTIDDDGKNAKRITSGTWSLPTSEPPGPVPSPLSWSPDGKLLLITKQETPAYGDNDRSSIQVVDVATGALRPLTGHKFFDFTPVFSPDGTRVAYWYSRHGDISNGTAIYVTGVNGGEGTDVTKSLDRSFFRALWMPDGKSLLVSGHDQTATAMWIVPADGGAARRLDLGEVSPSWAYWVDMNVGRDGAIAFT